MSTQEHAQPARKVVDEMQELLDVFPDFPWLSFRTADVRALIEYVRAAEDYDEQPLSGKLRKQIQEARRALGLEGE